jgi:hypothetical protein
MSMIVTEKLTAHQGETQKEVTKSVAMNGPYDAL